MKSRYHYSEPNIAKAFRNPKKQTSNMLMTPLIALGLAVTAVAQGTIPADYRKVYITSMVDTKFVVVPKAATSGSTTVVYAIYPP